MIINLILIWMSWLLLIILGAYAGVTTVMFLIFPIIFSLVVFGINYFSELIAFIFSLFVSIPVLALIIYGLITDGFPKKKNTGFNKPKLRNLKTIIK